MNSREVIAEAAKLAAERGWTEGDPHEAYLLYLLSVKEEARHSLRLKAQMLRGDLDRLEQILKAPSPLLNTLGELQQRPAAVEAAVGEFTAADKALREYLSAFPAQNPEG